MFELIFIAVVVVQGALVGASIQRDQAIDDKKFCQRTNGFDPSTDHCYKVKKVK